MPIVRRDITLMSRLLEKAQGGYEHTNTINQTECSTLVNIENLDNPEIMNNPTSSVASSEKFTELPNITRNYGKDQLASDANIDRDQSSEKEYLPDDMAQSSDSSTPCTPREQPPRKEVGFSTPEKSTLRTIFADNLTEGRYPSGEEIKTAIRTNEALQNRTPRRIRSWLQHYFKKIIR